MRIEQKERPKKRTLPEKLTPTQNKFHKRLDKETDLPKFQVKWNVNGYVVDFAFRRLKIAVYVREPRDISDNRTQALEDAGYTVLVYPPQIVKHKTDECLTELRQVIERRGGC